MIDRLYEATRPMHLEADADLDLLFDDRTHQPEYVAFLGRQYGFEAPLEAALARTPNLELMIELSGRQKAPLIAQDLLALGVRPLALATLPLCLRIAPFRGAAEALGWMYVVERATLAHSVIRRHLTTRLPRAMREAAAYLQAYSGQVGARWREFGSVLDDLARHPAIADRIIAAASEAFRTQRRWTQSEPRAVTVAAS